MKLAIALLTLAACGGPPAVPHSRFVNAPPVVAVNDRKNVAVTPKEREFREQLYHFDGLAQRPVDRTLGLERQRRALGVNAFDEVPDSTWFTNRIGVRDMTIAELVRGPVRIESPERHKPWTVKGTKVGGAEVGFTIEDSRGIKFLLKFDSLGFPEQETTTDVVVGKLLWACGYSVPEDFVVDLRREDLVIAPGAVMTDPLGDKHPLTRTELDRRLAMIEGSTDQRIRGYASRWLDGKSLGGHPGEGVRGDDPNDRIPHQLRRDLRGAYAFFAWLDHVDVQESNFLDMWVADRKDPKRHYVQHYLLDFGKSFGVMASTGLDPRHGHAYVIDVGQILGSFFTAGLVERSWEDRRAPELRGVGLFEAGSFDPGAWKPDYPSYIPLLTADRIDKFWATKILMRFTRDQLHAIVETGRYSDPRAVEYVTDTLVARQRATGAYWFARVNPLDGFAVDDHRLCFDDLAIRYHFVGAGSTSYRAVSHDRDARELGVTEARPDDQGRACTPLELSQHDDGYTILRVTTERPELAGSTYVHVARDPSSGAPRVIGIWRP